MAVLFLKSWAGRLLLPILLAALAAVAYERQWLRSVDYLLYDYAQQLRSPTALDQSVVIAIDEPSLAALGRWPWPRKTHAKLISVLSNGGSNIVYFDVLFAEQSNRADDVALATAIKNHGQVVLPLSIEPLGYQGQMVEVVPAAIFYSAAKALGHAHINCDFDGVCRSVYLREGVGQARWPHLSAALWPSTQATSGTQAANNSNASPLLIYRNYHNFIPFSPNDFVPKVSYIDVLEGRIPADFFNQKTVFIGATAAGVHDILTTPVGRLPGVEITAFIHHHLYAGNLIQLHQNTLISVLLLCLLALCLAGISLLSSAKLLFGACALIAIECALALGLLLGFNQWLPIAPVLLATVLFYPLWSWLRLELAMRYLKRSLVVHQSYSPPSAKLISHLNVQPCAPHWLVASDTVALAIGQLEAVSNEQQASHHLLQQSISGLQEGCIIFDATGHCFLVNDLAKAWLPFWLSDNVFDIEQYLTIKVNPDEQDTWAKMINTAFNQEATLSCEALALNASGSEIPANYFLQLRHCVITLGDQGAVIVGVLTLTDVSALKASERAREETLNFISHDLRSPLVSIISLIKYQREMACFKGSENQSVDHLLTKIERYANRNLAYSESLLQLNRAEHLLSSQTVLCDVLAVCEDAYEQVLPFARANHCPLTCKFNDDEFWVDGDYELLQRTVVNLLTNAVKYGASPHGVVLSLAIKIDSDDDCLFTHNHSLLNVNVAEHKQSPQNSEQPPKKDLKCSTTYIELTVQDYGAGMTATQKQQAFERFAREASANADGAGLGLYFVKTVIDKHKGYLQLQTEPGKGCKITCLLPSKSLEFMD